METSIRSRVQMWRKATSSSGQTTGYVFSRWLGSLLVRGVCSKPSPKMHLPACVVAGQREAWNDCPKVWNSDTSWLASLRRICSKRLTTSFEYNRSPHRRQTSVPTVTDARLTPPRSSFSTFFRTISPPHTGHALNGIILAPVFASRANEQGRDGIPRRTVEPHP